MAKTVPLIRTAAIVPWLRWLKANGRPVADRMQAAGLSFLDPARPNAPTPVLLLVEFIRQQARLEGHDIGYRVVSETSVRDLANLGLVALSAQTPQDSLTQVARYMPFHCSHEIITVDDRPEGLLVQETWMHTFDPADLHMIHQYVAALILSICNLPQIHPDPPCTVALMPHPDTGLAHLARWTAARLEPATAPKLSIRVPRHVAEARLPKFDLSPLDRASLANDWSRLRLRGILSESLSVAIEPMLPMGDLSVATLATVAGMTPRTLQRRLAEEGTSAFKLVDATRRRLALERIGQGADNFGGLARQLGYANASALTRAVRRWTGAPPSELRASGTG